MIIDRQRQIHQRPGRRRMVRRWIQRAAGVASPQQRPQVPDRRVIHHRRRIVKQKLAAQSAAIDATHRADQDQTANDAAEHYRTPPPPMPPPPKPPPPTPPWPCCCVLPLPSTKLNVLTSVTCVKFGDGATRTYRRSAEMTALLTFMNAPVG